MYVIPKYFLSGLTALVFAHSTMAQAQSTWSKRTSGTVETLSGVTYAGSQFVAVGENGVVLTSPDAISWTSRTSGVTSALRGVSSGNGTILAVGSGGTAITSPDGITWSTRDPRTSAFLSGAAFGNGVFVAVGGSGTVRFSADGVNWDFGLQVPTSFFQSVTFADGRFIAVGASGRIITSTNGQSWTLVTSGTTTYLTGITYAANKFIATGFGGTTLISDTGTSGWTFRTSGTFEWLKFVTSSPSGHAVAVGAAGTIVTSSDGVTWSPASSGLTDDIDAVAYGAGLFVAVGSPSGSPANGLILTSEEDLPPGLTFEAWRQMMFSPEDLNDLTISGADADPDKDGIPNFTEYALGLPYDSDSGRDALPAPAIVVGGDSQPHLVIDFKRPADRMGIVTYTARFSADLKIWQDVEVAEEILSEDNGIQSVRISNPDTATGNGFIQLSMSES
jgi:hypothetical protein